MGYKHSVHNTFNGKSLKAFILENNMYQMQFQKYQFGLREMDNLNLQKSKVSDIN